MPKNHSWMECRKLADNQDHMLVYMTTLVSDFFGFCYIVLKHGRGSNITLESVICGHHIYKQIMAVSYRRDTNLGTRGGQQPWQLRCRSPQGCYCRWPCSSRVFAGVLALPQDHQLSIFSFSCIYSFFASRRSSFLVLVQTFSSFFVLLDTFCSTHSPKFVY